jgi:transcriptional regulator with XRE-family HTH domain
MTASNRYLDRLAAQLGGASDYRLAKVLGVAHGAVSRYRAGDGQFDVRVAWRCAELLGIDAKEIIAAVQLERAKTEKDRAFWQAVATAAASILLGGVFGFQPAPANAFSGAPVDATGYTLRRKGTRRVR